MRSMLAQSDARRLPLADKSVHCVVTSPPYYGLRSYQCENQLGLEPTLQEYINNTVLWCREVWRVLRDDGTFWLNLGDSYAGSGGAGGDYNEGGLREGQPKYKSSHKVNRAKDRSTDKWSYSQGHAPGLKPKDLMLVPHRVAIALQNDGWWVRSDIVWHKPNPMPESVRDRPTKSHEYIFLLTKSKSYYYDQDAIREPHQDPADIHRRIRKDGQYKHDKSQRGWMAGSEERADLAVARGRNKRSVWTMTTKPYKEAHFATFPPELPETCIKAGTSEKGVCPVCGSQWERVAERDLVPTRKAAKTFVYDERDKLGHGTNDQGSNRARDGHKSGYITAVTTIGWKPTCSHNEEPIPATVLDCFGGSGTTAMVAKKIGRAGVSLDLSFEYMKLAETRCGKVQYQYSF